MSLFRYKKILRGHLEKITANGEKLGFVPTMGALHRGHLSIVEKALEDNDAVAVSIFVNPTQFDNPEDLEKYPRTLEADIEKLYKIHPGIVIFTPDAADIYDDNIEVEVFDFDGLENEMEGKYRKDHFNGVATVVKKLLEIVKPRNAYFGEKDYQQLLIVKKLVELCDLPVNIIAHPTEREVHGLAMSSRNERLSQAVRKEAAFIYNALAAARKAFETENIGVIKDRVIRRFKSHPDFNLEYVEIADAQTLKPAKTRLEDRKYRIFIAVYAEGVRLIDNIALN